MYMTICTCTYMYTHFGKHIYSKKNKYRFTTAYVKQGREGSLNCGLGAHVEYYELLHRR
jgi:hypothetical protein